jgi:hypothetical protein
MRSYWQQQLLLKMHGPIPWDWQRISDSNWAHTKLPAAAAAAANTWAHPIVSATPSRKVIGPLKPSAEAAEISIAPF